MVVPLSSAVPTPEVNSLGCMRLCCELQLQDEIDRIVRRIAGVEAQLTTLPFGNAERPSLQQQLGGLEQQLGALQQRQLLLMQPQGAPPLEMLAAQLPAPLPSLLHPAPVYCPAPPVAATHCRGHLLSSLGTAVLARHLRPASHALHARTTPAPAPLHALPFACFVDFPRLRAARLLRCLRSTPTPAASPCLPSTCASAACPHAHLHLVACGTPVTARQHSLACRTHTHLPSALDSRTCA